EDDPQVAIRRDPNDDAVAHVRGVNISRPIDRDRRHLSKRRLASVSFMKHEWRAAGHRGNSSCLRVQIRCGEAGKQEENANTQPHSYLDRQKGSLHATYPL